MRALAPGVSGRRRAALTLAAAAATMSCVDAGQSQAAVQVTDSAGVRIVTDLAAEVEVWRLGERPLMSLGGLDAPEVEAFARVGSARRLSDGGVVLYDVGSRELRIFDAAGLHVRSFGGPGEGPGEFRGTGRIRVLPGDTVAVWDTRLRRVTLFDVSGRVLSTRRTAEAGPASTFVGVYAGQVAVLASPIIVTESTSFDQRYARVLRFGPEAPEPDTLPTIHWTITGPLGISLFPGGGLAMGGRHFGATTELDGDHDGYWVGTQESEELVRYDLGGRVTTIVRWAGEGRDVPGGAADLLLEETLANRGGGDPDAMTRLHNAMPIAEEYPAYGSVIVGVDGSVWVEQYRRPGHQGPAAWRVFAGSGEPIAEIELPSDLRVRDVGPDYVLGLARDELDVEMLQLFAVERS